MIVRRLHTYLKSEYCDLTTFDFFQDCCDSTGDAVVSRFVHSIASPTEIEITTQVVTALHNTRTQWWLGSSGRLNLQRIDVGQNGRPGQCSEQFERLRAQAVQVCLSRISLTVFED